MAKDEKTTKDSLGRKAARRPEPPPYKDGDYLTAYNNTESFRTVTLDEGAFMYLWGNAHRQWKMLPQRTYLNPELISVINRVEEAFEAAAPDFMPEKTAPKSERGGSGKKERCPDCGTKKPKKIRKKDAPKWKCVDCGRVWDRIVPGEAPQEPSKGLETDPEGDDAPERPRKRQKPAKKKQKKASKA